MENKNAYKMVRTTDPDTSVDGAIHVDASALELEVLKHIKSYGKVGCSSDQLVYLMVDILKIKIRESSITPRYKALIDKGLIIVDETRKPSMYSKRSQRVMWATEHYIKKD